MEEECPKCGRTGLDPKYHKQNDPRCVEKDYITTETDEHLHYKCKCGYDFILPPMDIKTLIED